MSLILMMMMMTARAVAQGPQGPGCIVHNDTDTAETYFTKTGADNAQGCCSACSQHTMCTFASFDAGECYLKQSAYMTLQAKPGCQAIVCSGKPTPKPGPAPSPPSPPPTLPPVPPLPPAKYKVTLVEHSPEPTLSHANPVGKGHSPCNTTFNPSYVEIAGKNTIGGVIVRTDHCNETNGLLSFAECNVTTGVCGDLQPNYQVPQKQGIQDPRVVYNPYDEYFYMFMYSPDNYPEDGCGAPGTPGGIGACTVTLSRTQTPQSATSWEHVSGGTYPWHRNGCCWMMPTGQKTYCIFGESGNEGPGSGLGIAYTTDISKGVFTQTNWTGGVPGPNGTGLWMQALGDAYQEVKLEAGSHMVQLESGDLLHFYAAATPGWVANGNYTAGYIILDKDEPTKIIQRGSGQFMIPTYPYETLCNHGNTPPTEPCKYDGERRNVIFMCSATRIGPNRFRLFFGGGDGNVGTGVVEVSDV